VLFLLAGRPTLTNALLLEAFRRRGTEAERLRPGKAFSRVGAGDVVLARLDVHPTLDGVEPGLAELRDLEQRGADVLNPAGALLAAHDKLETALRLGRFGIPHPRTWHVGEDAGGVEARGAVVVKPRFGSWGRDVFLCRTQRALEERLRSLRRRAWFRRQGALVQELVPPLGYDLRVLVAGGEVVGSAARLAAPGEWRTNVALGGRRLPLPAPDEAQRLALAAAASLSADLVGVDLLPLPDGGWTVLELNGAVDFTAQYSVPGRDVFDEAARALDVPAPVVGLAGAAG
jgi:RimK family alpha-L-glutamate ligase